METTIQGLGLTLNPKPGFRVFGPVETESPFNFCGLQRGTLRSDPRVGLPRKSNIP